MNESTGSRASAAGAASNRVGLMLILFLSSAYYLSSKGTRVLLAVFAVDLGASSLDVGLIFGLFGLCPLLFAVQAGRLADRFGNHFLLYAGFVGYAASLCIPYLLPTLFGLYLTSALVGGSTMLYLLAAMNLVGALSASPKERTRNFSLFSLSESCAFMLGPILLGFASDQLGHAAAFLLSAAAIAACSVVLVIARRVIPDVRVPGKTASSASRSLLGDSAIRNVLIANGVVISALDIFNVYMPVYTRELGFSATTIGLIMGSFGAAAIVVRLLIPPISARWGERVMLATALAASSGTFVWASLTADPLVLACAAFVLGLGLGCGQPLTMILAFNAAPAGRSAEVMGMRLAVGYGAHLAIPPVFGVVGAAVGLAPVFWASALLLSVGAWSSRSTGASVVTPGPVGAAAEPPLSGVPVSVPK